MRLSNLLQGIGHDDLSVSVRAASGAHNWVGFEGSIEINFYGLYKNYIGFISH